MSQSVLLVPFRELAAAVEPWLEHSVGARPSHGIPPHVTLLFPFPPPDESVVAEATDALAKLESFDVMFGELRRFTDTKALYLTPDPVEPFIAVIESLVATFPGWLPYGGAYDSIVPHLTVAWGAQLDEAEADLEPRLPLRARAREAVLLTEVQPRRWLPHTSFPLKGV